MTLFLDTSVLIAACGSTRVASREVCRRAPANGWGLTITPYVANEVDANIGRFPPDVRSAWGRLRPSLRTMPDVLTLDRPAVFGPGKDRPILFAALAWADVLLTLDRSDFGRLLGGTFYGLPVLTPGQFLEAERTAGRLT